jgi:RimJ/RimL family protein N-acetyltransferase
MNTELEKDCFEFHWKTYLNLIEKVAFLELRLHKIFTYAFDLRPELYKTIEKVGFTKKAVLKEHCFLDEKFIDVIIHEKMNKEDKCFLRRIDESDVKILFDWANDNMVRKNALHSDPILWKKHMTWFKKKLDSTETFIYILETSNAKIGQVRIDSENGYWTIDYSISKEFRGKGYGKLMIMLLLKKVVKKPLLALVKENNIPSQKVFEELEFKKSKNSKNDLIKYIYE